MKKIIIYILFICFNTVCFGQIIFNDTNFKNKLLEADASLNNIATTATGGPITIDTNHNGEIEVAEALTVYRLSIGLSGINNLTGLGAFTNLMLLQCGENNLTTIDLSQLIHLEHLACYQNQLTTLNISALTNLKNLFFFNNQISAIDFSNNPQLEVTYCGNNQLTSLDFSSNPLFHDLGCKNNPSLTTIKINNGAMQVFGATTWLNECWTGLPNLTTICADANEIDLVESYLLGCVIDTSGITITSNCALGYEQFSVNEVVVYPNPASGNVNISSNVNIKKVELIDVQGRILISKLVDDSNATFDLSSYSNGVYYVKVVGDGGSRIEKLVKK
jgi:Secretion system C-terminal sorting domain